MDSYFETLKKYSDFEGRASRKEYWNFALTNFITAILLMIAQGVASTSDNPTAILPFTLLYYLFQIGTIIPSIAVGVRRMHDTNHSGWFVLLPIVNLIFFLQKGDQAKNTYGPVPKKIV